MINIFGFIQIFSSESSYEHFIIIPLSLRLIKIALALNRACYNLKIGLNMIDIIRNAEIRILRILIYIITVIMIFLAIGCSFYYWNDESETLIRTSSLFDVIFDTLHKIEKALAWQNYENFFKTAYDEYSIPIRVIVFIYYSGLFFLIRIIGFKSIFGVLIFSKNKLTIDMYINKLKKGYLVNNEYIEYLLKKWLYFDPEGSGFIEPNHAIFLVSEIKAPLGISTKLKGIINTQNFNVYENNLGDYMISPTKKTNFNKKNIFKILEIFDIPIYKHNGSYKCHFLHVIQKLLRISMSEKYESFNPK